MQLQVRGHRKLYCGETMLDVIHLIRRDMAGEGIDLTQWMQGYAKAMKERDGSKIDVSSPGQFMITMRRAGEFHVWD